MNPTSILVFSLAIIAISCVIAFIFHQISSRRVAELQTKNDVLDSQLKEALSARAAAEANSSRIPELERHIAELQCEKGELMKENAALKQQHENDTKNIQLDEARRQQLKEAFASLSSEALKNNSEAYLGQARAQFQGILDLVKGDWGTHKVELQKMVEPLEKTLKNLDLYTKEIEVKREGAYSGIQEQLRALSDAQGTLQITAAKLTQAMRAPNVRGNWGQVQLKRIVEMVGLLDNVDFGEQIAVEEGRPDMIVNLPNKGILPVDAKTPMTSYLDALDSDDEAFRQLKFQELTITMRNTIKNLGNRGYWKKFDRTPEVVIMFIPSDGCIAAAFEHDIGLFEYAVSNSVIITSPFTLYALLKAVAYGWQQHQVTENAMKIADESRELHDRLIKFITHLSSMGGGLKRAVDSFNDSIGSFNRRVLPVAKRLGDMGASAKEIEPLSMIEIMPQIPQPIDDNKLELN